MANGLWEKLRGARRIELFAALALAALLALALIGGAAGREGDPAKTELEARVERILSRVEGAGRVSAMITQDEDGGAAGAVIVAEGLSDARTYLNLQRAVSALLELESAKIEIIGRDGSFGGAL